MYLDWWPPLRLPNRPRLSRYWSDLIERSASPETMRLESITSGGKDCMARLTRGREAARSRDWSPWDSWRLLEDRWRVWRLCWLPPPFPLRSSVASPSRRPRWSPASSERLRRLYLWLGTRVKRGGTRCLTSDDNSPWARSFSDLPEARSLEPRPKRPELLAAAVGFTWTNLKKLWWSTQHWYRCLQAFLLGVWNP